MRMVQGGDGARFLLEPLAVRPVQNLDGDDAIQPRVARLLHLAHAACTDRREDLVGAKVFAHYLPRHSLTIQQVRCHFESRVLQRSPQGILPEQRRHLAEQPASPRHASVKKAPRSRGARSRAKWYSSSICWRR